MKTVAYVEKESPTSTDCPSISSSGLSSISSPSRSSNDDLSPMKTEWSFSLKGKLRQVITDKRALTGNGDGDSELDSPRDETNLNPDELVQLTRQERVRKERNRLAAQRMRDRRKRYHETLVTEMGGLETDNQTLETEIEDLERERQRLEFVLSSHASFCTLLPKVDINRNVIRDDRSPQDNDWTPAHNVAYLLNSNSNSNNNNLNNNMNDTLSSSYDTDHSSRWNPHETGDDSLARTHSTQPDKVAGEGPLDLSTTQTKVRDVPLDLRVPRGIKHKMYIQQSEQIRDEYASHRPVSESDHHRQFHKKLRLFPSVKS